MPPWLKLLHHGDLTGSNALQHVRALFVVGRPLASAEAVTRMTEALFGDYIAERDYKMRKKGGRIPIVPDAAGNNVVLVDVWEHPDPRAERVRRQVTEAQLRRLLEAYTTSVETRRGYTLLALTCMAVSIRMM